MSKLTGQDTWVFSQLYWMVPQSVSVGHFIFLRSTKQIKEIVSEGILLFRVQYMDWLVTLQCNLRERITITHKTMSQLEMWWKSNRFIAMLHATMSRLVAPALIWFDSIRFDSIRFDLIWFDLIWLVWFDLIWFVACSSSQLTIFSEWPNWNVQSFSGVALKWVSNAFAMVLVY